MKYKFPERLKQLRQDNGNLSYEEFAQKIKSSKAAVHDWEKGKHIPRIDYLATICRVFKVSADWLLGLKEDLDEVNTKSSPDNITYVKKPTSAPGYEWVVTNAFGGEIDSQDIEVGVQYFESLLLGNATENFINDQNRRRCFRIALETKALQIKNVLRDEKLENQLKRKLPLKEAYVLQLPATYHEEKHIPIVAVELLSFLATKMVLNRADFQPRRVAWGPGYTMYRTASNIDSRTKKYMNTRWIPISAISDPDDQRHNANFIVRLLENKHPGSKALYSPFLESAKRDFSDAEQLDLMQQKVRDITKELNMVDAIFLSVGEIPKDSARLRSPYTGGDGESVSETMIETFMKMSPEDQSLVEGELWGHFLDRKGDVLTLNSHFYFPPSLSLMRDLSENCPIWIVASGENKARSVEVVVRTGIANRVVVDSILASTILELA